MEYYAKPGILKAEHDRMLEEQLNILKEYNYIGGELYALEKNICLHHDDGKENPVFQNRVTSPYHLRFDPSKEVSHNVLSVFLLNPDLFPSKADYYRAAFAIMYHHYHIDPYMEILDKRDLAKQLLAGHQFFPVTTGTANQIQKMMTDDKAVLLKGFLHKCDYSASGGYTVEYPNDFLLDSMENVKRKWQARDPESDWNELQEFCMENRDSNIIAVAPTGMGKTEAGLQWIGNRKGYFVLPLRTAINAIYERIRNDVLQGEGLDTRLSILHSESLEYYIRHLDDPDLDAKEYADRGKRLSMPLNISTMDQIFDFVFKFPGYELKLATFSYSRFVIDEIQMYDPEMLAYLVCGLKQIVHLGGKVAILTATLSPFLKDLLKEEIPFQEEKVFTGRIVRHHVVTRKCKLNAADISALYRKNETSGRSNKILVVCNTVRKAQEMYGQLKCEFGGKVHILHSRFIHRDRARKEKQIIEFGKTFDENGGLDVQSGIWVCTSLVEASLDIDFDYLFTELQDLNSLLQRMGRVNRKGFKDIGEPNCFIYLEIEEKLLRSRNGFIDDTIFHISQKALEGIEGILTEQDKMDLINEHLTSDHLKKSEYYRGKKGYIRTKELIMDLTPYKYKRNEEHFRDIATIDIMPHVVYEENKETIGRLEKIVTSKDSSLEEKILAKEEMMGYAVNISYWQWLDYCKAVKTGKAEVYSDISLGHFGSLKVMECSYDDYGFRKLDYDNIQRKAEFL